MAKRKPARKQAEPSPPLRLEWLDADDLRANDFNWRSHPAAQENALRDVLAEVGWAGALLYNERTGRLIDGHLRKKVAAGQRVPVLVGNWDEGQEKKILATLDPIAAMATADRDRLDALLRDVQTGSEALARMLTELAEKSGIVPSLNGQTPPEDAGPQVDRAAELLEKWRVERGQLWLIPSQSVPGGVHRLLCGDSTVPQDVARVMGGQKISALIFDPPWDAGAQQPDGNWQHTLAFTDGRRLGQTVGAFGAPTWVFVWDCQACWYAPNRPLQRVKLCLWYGDLDAYDPDGAHYGEPGDAKVVSNSRGTYNYQPDPRGKHLSDLFVLQLATLHAKGNHQHEKPADWVRLLIGNCTRGDVFDPYVGSGTTFVACEHLGRIAYGVEIDPSIVAVSLERLSELGLLPTLDVANINGKAGGGAPADPEHTDA
jgi:hypothetical protein